MGKSQFIFPFILLVSNISRFQTFLISNIQKQALPIDAALYGNSPVKTVNITFRIVPIIILAKGGTIIFGYGMFIFSIFVGGYCQLCIRLIFKLTKQPIREVRAHSQLNPKRF